MKHILVFIVILLVASCAATIDDYEGENNTFMLDEFFDGHLIAYGVIEDAGGKFIRDFCVEIEATWQGDDQASQGVIDETFYFNDGEISERVWTVNAIQDNGERIYTGTAGDVAGEARGKARANVFQWLYTLNIPLAIWGEEKQDYAFAIDDWIYQIDEKRAMNRSSMSKFGFHVGEIMIFFEKLEHPARCS